MSRCCISPPVLQLANAQLDIRVGIAQQAKAERGVGEQQIWIAAPLPRWRGGRSAASRPAGPTVAGGADGLTDFILSSASRSTSLDVTFPEIDGGWVNVIDASPAMSPCGRVSVACVSTSASGEPALRFGKMRTERDVLQIGHRFSAAAPRMAPVPECARSPQAPPRPCAPDRPACRSPAAVAPAAAASETSTGNGCPPISALGAPSVAEMVSGASA